MTYVNNCERWLKLVNRLLVVTRIVYICTVNQHYATMAKKAKATEKQVLTTEDKMKLRLKMVKETGLSIKRCEAFLDKFSWDLKKVYEHPTVKSAIKKKAKAEQKEAVQAEMAKYASKPDEKSSKFEPVKPGKKTKVSFPYFIKAKRGKPTMEFECEQRADGLYYNGKKIHCDSSGLYAPFLSQEEQQHWMKTYGHVDHPGYVNRIIEINKKLGTNYPLTEAGWNLISKYETFSEKELDDLDPYIVWNTYLTFHPHTFSEKFRKKKADHFTLVELGLISYKGEPGPRPAEYCIVTNSRQRKRTGSS